MTSVLFKKRDQFHSKIRAQYLEDYMKKIRYQVLQHQSNNPTNYLNSFIEATQAKITQNQVKFLIDWANQKDQNNSIIHIGNLLIDGLIDIEFLFQNFQLRPKNSQYWCWLIRVIFSLDQSQQYLSSNKQNYLNWKNKSIEYILVRLSSVQSSFCLSECLQILKALLQKQPQPIIHTLLTTHKGAILSIRKNTVHFEKNISELCYEILDMIIQSGDNQTIELINICSLADIQHILILGFNKIDSAQKKFPLIVCRMINNIYTSKIMMSETVMNACLNISLNENNSDKVKVELSFLWLSFFEICNSQMILNALKGRVFNVFQTFLINPCKKLSNFKTIMENIAKSFKKILEKAQQLDEKTFMQINSKVDMLVRQFNLIQNSSQQKSQEFSSQVLHQQNINIQQGNFEKQSSGCFLNVGQTCNESQMDLEE